MIFRISWALLLIGGGLSGCIDIRDYSGRWVGSIVPDPAVRAGFDGDVRVDPLDLSAIDLSSIEATLTTSDGRFEQTELRRIEKSFADRLAGLTFDGDPLRTYLLFAPLQGEPAGRTAWLVLSLFDNDRLELRVLRDDDLYGVFPLERAQD